MTPPADGSVSWIVGLARRHETVFVALFSLAACAQTILLTVVPLEALHLLHSARAVTLLYLVNGIAGLTGRLTIPLLCARIPRRWVMSLGVLAAVAGARFLALDTPLGLLVGLILCTFAFSSFEIAINLYVLDHISRRAVARFEPLRVFFSAAPWTLGPWLGVYLQQGIAREAPFEVTALSAVLLLALVWTLRLRENVTVAANRTRAANPLRYVRRFFAQPRLVVAWLLASGRAAWWAAFFVYTPIFATDAGLSAEVSGILVSCGTAWMWTAPLWGWLGRRYGLRRLLFTSYLVTGILTLATAALLHYPWIGAAMLLIAAFSAEAIEGAGNALFLRAVHPYERAEMTAVYVTYRDLAQSAAPMVFALLLSLFDLASVFVATATIMLLLTLVARHIPSKM